MKAFSLKITSPDGNLFVGDALNISLRGTEGELAVMAGHVPFVTSILPCRFRIIQTDETELWGETDGGLLTVSSAGVLFLTGALSWDTAEKVSFTHKT